MSGWQPRVAAIMLTADRNSMAVHAWSCFHQQSYPWQSRGLFILDTGKGEGFRVPAADHQKVCIFRMPELNGWPIGALRNVANLLAYREWQPYVFIHWDDDDVSGQYRIERQVRSLGESRAEIAGFCSIPFLDERENPARAWIYNNNDPGYCIGASLCYRTDAWFARQFPPISMSEDTAFCEDRTTHGEVSIKPTFDLVARMHAASTSVRNMKRFESGEDDVFRKLEGADAQLVREFVQGRSCT